MVLKRFLIAAAAVAAMTAGQAYAAAVEYTVGTGATYRPFEFQNAKKELVGFDIDLVKEIAKAQGFKVKFVNTAWSVIFESLKNGDRDFIISGITITPQRKETIDFS
ncbi:MAG: transporter substrate-binding domain-containing protein, partial [Mesosutterella sp.]|nr:transporter substrate-binding domain-containing protein [Mesosutterella sp.]